ncbi:MAG: transcriptional regulator [Rhodobacteraceae bacterium]|nr:putative DNA binding domain-containing protein [Paracoccaceae bacterium]MYJ86357.1 transcriptional regulator [Paracoccaceae bacterium]
MLTTNELMNQIQLGEDTSLELKDLRFKGNTVNDPRRNSMADELAAMANTANGVLVLGADDKSKTINGIPENKLDAVESWIREICNDLISPPLLCLVRKHKVLADDGSQKAIIRVDVPKSLHVHRSPGGYFQRIGSSKREMTPEVLARLFQQRSQTRIIHFDEQPVPTATVDSLDKMLYEKFKTDLSPDDDEEFLFKLKLLTKDEDSKIYASVSGVLMACKKPHEYLTNSFIQAVSYRGTERNAAYQLDARDIVGPLDAQILEACWFIEKNMKIFAVKEPARRDIPQYSQQAVFEAIVNAVTHRDYSIFGSKIRLHMFSDRLELFSPGTIPNSMTIDSLPLRQSTRNELLTSLLARCPLPMNDSNNFRNYFMDKRGEGVPIILTESQKLSGRLPEYRLIDDSELLLTIYAAQPPND